MKNFTCMLITLMAVCIPNVHSSEVICEDYIMAANIVQEQGIIKHFNPITSVSNKIYVRRARVFHKAGWCMFELNGRLSQPFEYYVKVRRGWRNLAYHQGYLRVNPKYPEFLPGP